MSDRAKRQLERRGFLKRAALGAGAAALGPNVLLRAEETMERSGVMGPEGRQYEWVGDFFEIPKHLRLGYTHAVRQMKDGRYFVCNTGRDATAIFDPDGKYMGSWGKEYAENAHGMDYNVEDGVEYLYLAPTGYRKVVKCTLDGEKVFELDYPSETGHYENEEEYCPTNIAILPDGQFYVADGYGKGYIIQYTADGEYVRSWGGPGELNCPHGIWIDDRGDAPRILVADRGNERLRYYSLEGEHMEDVQGTFNHPCHFDERDGDVLIPGLFGVVLIMDRNNEIVARLGENPGCKEVEGWPNIAHEKRLPGKFSSPHGASYDNAGNIVVAEWIDDGRVTLLRRVG